MATVMTKRGSLDNVVTFEHICDVKSDLADIDPFYVTLGSTAIVLKGENGLEVYMASSEKEWIPLLIGDGNGGGGSASAAIEMHICSAAEVGLDGKPAIDNPEENVIYLVPNNNDEEGNLFDEYIYVNDAWEEFSSSVILEGVTADWLAGQGTNGYISNKPTINKGAGENSVIENNASAASGNNSHAEGLGTIASGNNQHVSGKYNIEDTANKYVEIIGNGAENNRSNARTLDWNGNETLAGNLTIQGNSLTLGGSTFTADNLGCKCNNQLKTLTVIVTTPDNTSVTGQMVMIQVEDENGAVYATTNYNGQPVAFPLQKGFQYYVSVSDNLPGYYDPSTATGIIGDTDVTVTLQYKNVLTSIKTARDIKNALNGGADLTDLVGEQITCTKGEDTLVWDIVDYNAANKNVTLLLHKPFQAQEMLFEPPQALMWCENGLAAGSYTFKNGSTSYYFTTTVAVPAGGQLRAIDSQFQTYASQDATAALETGTVRTEEIVNATNLGHYGQGLLNHYDRVKYGSSNFAESALFWWLNSDTVAKTLRIPVTKFSRAYSYPQPGFMKDLNPDFISCIDVTGWLCSTNNVYECPESLGGYTKGIGQTYVVKGKFGLASETEIFGNSYGGNVDGSEIFDLYRDATAQERKKYMGNIATGWWLRLPYRDSYSTYSETAVHADGNATIYTVSHLRGVVPCCKISADPR